MQALTIELEQTLQAPLQKVWQALTNPDFTQQYMFGCAVQSTWELGTPVLWQGKTADGQAIIYVKGQVEAIQAPNLVQFTMFDPNVGLADLPENYVSLRYELQANDAQQTIFKLSQGDYATVANGPARYEESLQGWQAVLPLLKELVEKQ